jgi:hypothetical protein
MVLIKLLFSKISHIVAPKVVSMPKLKRTGAHLQKRKRTRAERKRGWKTED